MSRLSEKSILSRMYHERPNYKGIKLAVWELETNSVFAIENIHRGHFDIAENINMPAARKAYNRIARGLRHGEVQPARLNEALLAWEQALAFYPKFRPRG